MNPMDDEKLAVLHHVYILILQKVNRSKLAQVEKQPPSSPNDDTELSVQPPKDDKTGAEHLD